MSKKKTPSRLGTNIPVTHGLSTLFGGAAAEQTTEINSEDRQEVMCTSESPKVNQISVKKITQEIPDPQVTVATSAIPVSPVTPEVAAIPATAKVPKKKKVIKKPVAPAATVADSSAEFTPTRGLPPGWERHTYVIQTRQVELIEAAAYWSRLDKKDVLQAAIDEYFKDRKPKPLPIEKRRERKPRAGTKK